VCETVTENVISWLRNWGVPHIRINGDDIDCQNGLTTELSANAAPRCRIRGMEFDHSQVKVVWYRKWRYANTVNAASLSPVLGREGPRDLTLLANHLNRELMSVSYFYFYLFRDARWLGNPWRSAPNKLEVLHRASLLGLDIPSTLVTTDPIRLRQFADVHGRVICKPSSDALMLDGEFPFLMTYTSEVTTEDLHSDAWRGGFPSQFQELLDKEYELRIFFLDGIFYTCAIYTQANPLLAIDSRLLDEKNPARAIPYMLPEDICNKLAALCAELGLDTCSIDMVRTRSGRYVFLEVNPVGQFEEQSVHGNFHLERKVAEALVRRLTEHV